MPPGVAVPCRRCRLRWALGALNAGRWHHGTDGLPSRLGAARPALSVPIYQRLPELVAEAATPEPFLRRLSSEHTAVLIVHQSMLRTRFLSSLGGCASRRSVGSGLAASVMTGSDCSAGGGGSAGGGSGSGVGNEVLPQLHLSSLWWEQGQSQKHGAPEVSCMLWEAGRRALWMGHGLARLGILSGVCALVRMVGLVAQPTCPAPDGAAISRHAQLEALVFCNLGGESRRPMCVPQSTPCLGHFSPLLLASACLTRAPSCLLALPSCTLSPSSSACSALPACLMKEPGKRAGSAVASLLSQSLVPAHICAHAPVLFTIAAPMFLLLPALQTVAGDTI